MYPPLSNTTTSIPFSIAFLATNSPTSLAPSLFPPFAAKSFSKLEAATNVTPFISSITCAYIFFSLLNTESLGLSAVPKTFYEL